MTELLNSRRDGGGRAEYTPADEFILISREVGSTQVITNLLDTLVSFTTESEDDPGWFSAGTPTQLTVNKEAYITIAAYCFWSVNSLGLRSLVIKHNGTIIAGDTVDATASAAPFNAVNVNLHVVDTDTIQFEVYQNRGGTLNLRAIHVGVTLEYVP